MMDCPDCGEEMIWQNDWDLSDDSEDEVRIQTDYDCPNEDCGLYLSIIRKHKKKDDE